MSVWQVVDVNTKEVPCLSDPQSFEVNIGFGGKSKLGVEKITIRITDKDGVKEYTPSENELNKTLSKAKEMDKKIMKDIHPEEFKKLEDLKIKKEKEDA